MPSATENKGKSPGMEEARLLAPWYAAGTLDAAEARELEELAKEDAELAQLIAGAKHEMDAAVFVNEALGEPSPAVWRRIETSIGQEQLARRSFGIAKKARSARASLSRFLAGLTMPQWQAIAAVALALCVIQAGAVIYLAGSGNAPSKYRAASGQKARGAAKPSAFIVSFSENASIGDVSKALDEAGAVIVDGPNADMLYHIGLREDKLEAKDQAYTKLSSSGLVKLILPEK
jgi:anti-sigma-K factor RskA